MIHYTDAPEAYDGFGTRTLLTTRVRGQVSNNPIRKVSIDPDHLEWQQGRYMSGMYFCLTEEAWKKDADLYIRGA